MRDNGHAEGRNLFSPEKRIQKIFFRATKQVFRRKIAQLVSMLHTKRGYPSLPFCLCKISWTWSGKGMFWSAGEAGIEGRALPGSMPWPRHSCQATKPSMPLIRMQVGHVDGSW